MTILDKLKSDPVRNAWTMNDIVALTREPIVKVLAEVHGLEKEGKIHMDGGLYHLTEKAWEEIK